jgi:tetratricopeptide (TPR) repeat protein
LHQGDFEGAERFRRRAERLALQANQRQMFVSTLVAELIAYALASDLTGIRQLADAIDSWAARFPGWRGYKYLADGYFEHARGCFDAACSAFERGLAVSEPDSQDPARCFGSWPRLEAGYIEALVSLDRASEAKTRGERALRICREYGIKAAAFGIRRALGLAEAKLGDYETASKHLEEVIGGLNALAITGLELGATFEARARIAIWAGDRAAIEHYCRLTAKEYRHGERSPLGARYERLMDEAHRAGVIVLPELTEFQTKLTTSNWRNPESAYTTTSNSLAGARTAGERAESVLRLLCEARAARSGHLYLYQEGGLELVASRGQGTPDAELAELVVRYVTQQLRSDDCATVIETESTPRFSSECWFDQHGASHQLMPLMSQRGTARLCAGVAVMESSGQSVVDASARRLVTELTEELLRLGDASGITEAVA